MKIRIFRYIILTGLTILLTSCYSDYVYLNYKTFPGACWNNDKTQIAFVASTSAYQHAKGIAAFPDGGTPKYLYKDVSLYLIDTSSLRLLKLVNFNDLEDVMKNRWYAELYFKDSLIYYNIKPSTSWNQYLAWAKNDKDSTTIYKLGNQYSKLFNINILSRQVKKIDSSLYFKIAKEDSGINKIDLTSLNNLLANLPVSDWGLRIKEISSKSDDEYINDIIYHAKDGSSLTKRAIIEQIIVHKSNEEKREILDAMDKYKNSLNGLDKTEYEMYSKESYELIKKLL